MLRQACCRNEQIPTYFKHVKYMRRFQVDKDQRGKVLHKY